MRRRHCRGVPLRKQAYAFLVFRLRRSCGSFRDLGNRWWCRRSDRQCSAFLRACYRGTGMGGWLRWRHPEISKGKLQAKGELAELIGEFDEEEGISLGHTLAEPNVASTALLSLTFLVAC